MSYSGCPHLLNTFQSFVSPKDVAGIHTPVKMRHLQPSIRKLTVMSAPSAPKANVTQHLCKNHLKCVTSQAEMLRGLSWPLSQPLGASQSRCMSQSWIALMESQKCDHFCPRASSSVQESFSFSAQIWNISSRGVHRQQ